MMESDCERGLGVQDRHYYLLWPIIQLPFASDQIGVVRTKTQTVARICGTGLAQWFVSKRQVDKLQIEVYESVQDIFFVKREKVGYCRCDRASSVSKVAFNCVLQTFEHSGEDGNIFGSGQTNGFASFAFHLPGFVFDELIKVGVGGPEDSH